MPKGMLGMLPLSAVQGPKATLDERLAGADGAQWLEELKRFLRKEPTWWAKTADTGSDSDTPTPLNVSSGCQAKFSGRFIRPAKFTSAEIVEILNASPRGDTHDILQSLLMENGNNPTAGGSARHKPTLWANKFFRQPFHGKYYRMAIGEHEGIRWTALQIWEVSLSEN